MPDIRMTEVAAIADLKPHPRNYRAHPDDQLGHLIESIREHGLYRNVVIAQDGTILAGHGVVKAAAQMGLEAIPVVRLPIAPDDPRALKVLTGDNEIEHLAEQDDRLLSELLKEIKDADADLLGTGYDEMMLANLVMVTRPASEVSDFDAAAAWTGLPEYEAGGETLKVIVSVRTEADRAALMLALGAPAVSEKNGSTWAFWWPPKERDDMGAVKFEG